MIIKKIGFLSAALLVGTSGNAMAGEKTNIFEPLTAEQRHTAEEADQESKKSANACSGHAGNGCCDGHHADDGIGLGMHPQADKEQRKDAESKRSAAKEDEGIRIGGDSDPAPKKENLFEPFNGSATGAEELPRYKPAGISAKELKDAIEYGERAAAAHKARRDWNDVNDPGYIQREAEEEAVRSLVRHKHIKKYGPGFKEKAADAIEDGVIGGVSQSIATIISKIIISGVYSAWDGTKYVAKRIWASSEERKYEEIQRRFEDIIKRSTELDNKITLNKAELAISIKEKENKELEEKVQKLRSKKIAEQQAQQSELLRKPEQTAAAAA